MRRIKSTRREEIAVIGNLKVFRNACSHLYDPTITVKISAYTENMEFNRSHSTLASNVIQGMHRSPDIARISSVFSDGSLRFSHHAKLNTFVTLR